MCSLGLMTKTWSKDKKTLDKVCSTTFRELLISIASSESKTSYLRQFAALDHAMRVIAKVPQFSKLVMQYHSDYHCGEGAARAQHYPDATFVGDFAHLTGATRRPKHAVPCGLDEETASVWRSGIFAVMQKYVSPSMLDVIRQAVYVTRQLPLYAFSSVWGQALQVIQREAGPRAAGMLRRQYLQELGDDVLESSWRASPCRIQPGSNVGSQPQESWHCHRLKASLPCLRLPMDMVMTSLREFMSARAEELEAADQLLYDAPCLHWNADMLEAARVYLANKAYAETKDDDGNLWVAMRATPEGVSQGVRPVTQQVVQQLRSLVQAQSHAEAEKAAMGLGGAPGHDAAALQATFKALGRWVLVSVGPASQRLWRCDAVTACSHTFGVCWLCSDFSKYGCCVHLYVAGTITGLIRVEVPWKQGQQRAKAATVPATLAPEAWLVSVAAWKGQGM